MNMGLIPRAVEQLFTSATQLEASQGWTFQMKVHSTPEIFGAHGHVRQCGWHIAEATCVPAALARRKSLTQTGSPRAGEHAGGVQRGDQGPARQRATRRCVRCLVSSLLPAALVPVTTELQEA